MSEDVTLMYDRRDLDRLVAMADSRWRSHIDGWAQDFARHVPALLSEVDRLQKEATTWEVRCAEARKERDLWRERAEAWTRWSNGETAALTPTVGRDRQEEEQ